MEPGWFFIYILNTLMKRLAWLTKVKKRIISDFTTNIRSGSALLFKWKTIRSIISNEHKAHVNTNRTTMCRYQLGFSKIGPFLWLQSCLGVMGHWTWILSFFMFEDPVSRVWGPVQWSGVWGHVRLSVVWRSFPRVHGLGFYHRVWSLGSCWMVRGPTSGPRV